jgi:hypothetical protein
MEDEYDTSYFECRHPWGASGGGVPAEQACEASNDYHDISESSSCCSSPISENDEEVNSSLNIVFHFTYFFFIMIIISSLFCN